MRFMVCRWPQSQEGDQTRPHLCRFAWNRFWPVWKRLSRDHAWRGRLQPGCLIVGSVTIEWLTTEAYDQSSLHCVVVSTGAMSDHIGRQDASCGGRCSDTSMHMSICVSFDDVKHTLWRREADATLVSTGSHETCCGRKQCEIRRMELWSWVSMRSV